MASECAGLRRVRLSEKQPRPRFFPKKVARVQRTVRAALLQAGVAFDELPCVPLHAHNCELAPGRDDEYSPDGFVPLPVLLVHAGNAREATRGIFEALLAQCGVEAEVLVLPTTVVGLRFKEVGDAMMFATSWHGRCVEGIPGPLIVFLVPESCDLVTQLQCAFVQRSVEVLQPQGKVYEPECVPGLVILLDYVGAEEERALSEFVQSGELEHLNRRSVRHYGFAFDYESRGVDSAQREWPKEMAGLAERLQRDLQLDFELDQVTANLYPPSGGIPHHVDTHSVFHNGIVSISLLGGCVMEFTKENGAEHHVYVPPRSALLMRDECRFGWMHGITPRKSNVIDGQLRFRSQRLSLTFRGIRFPDKDGPCLCEYASMCDSQKGSRAYADG